PERTPGLAGKSNDAELKNITREIWGDLDGNTRKERTAGAGKVFWGQPLSSLLNQLNIKPDFEFSSPNAAIINYIHRKIGDSDVYFVANPFRKQQEVVAAFRITGKKPELWNPDTGEITPIEVYDRADGRTKVPLQFDPAGSFFIVFRSPVIKYVKGVEKEGTAIISTKDFPSQQTGKYPDITNNFTITAWVKPETDENFNSAFGLGRGLASNVFYPPEGERVYGSNHVACGLIAARNGFIVYERANDSPALVLPVPMLVAGWTHVALVYKNGAPFLYVNGKLEKGGTASGKMVHPGLGEAVQDYFAWYFEGDKSELQLFREVLTEERIRQLFHEGAPLPEEPFPVQITAGVKGELLFWQNGRYTVQSNTGQNKLLPISGIEKPIELRNPWTIHFPPNLGAPDKISLSKLISLHRHPEDGVKYFSGTATYTNTFNVPVGLLSSNKRLFLDLGRVEILADINVNGKALGILWKPPFRIDITEAVKPGANNLEVQVTNLWPNRLIGDEQLPAENEYGNTSGGGVGNVVSGGGIHKLPDWYIEGKPKPAGGRVAFTTWKHYNKDAPLLESGLIGPVLLRTAMVQTIKY
ncbi:MAG: glycosyl hydrolase family 43, partial [Flavisolibacter sp.]|nr:glycosyl hydrolase family 43 [Flavisolibacter sp.]